MYKTFTSERILLSISGVIQSIPWPMCFYNFSFLLSNKRGYIILNISSTNEIFYI